MARFGLLPSWQQFVGLQWRWSGETSATFPVRTEAEGLRVRSSVEAQRMNSTLLGLVASFVLAGAPAPGSVQERLATLETRSGELSTRPLGGLEFAGLAELEAVAVRFAPPLTAEGMIPRIDRAWVRFAGSDAVAARIASADGEALSLELAPSARLDVTIDDIRSIVFEARVREHLSPTAPESGDRLYWLRARGVDRVDGTFESFASDGVVFDSALGTKTFPWSEIGALFIEPLGAAPTVERSARSVALELRSGGQLRGELLAAKAGVLQFSWRGVTRLDLPFDLVREVLLDDGSVEHLSSIAPVSANEGWPEGDELGMHWPYQLNRSVMGGPLTVGGRTWSRGIGVHAPSRLEWRLDGGWKTLVGAAAIDDSVGRLSYHGSVRCSIFVGDASTPAWTSGKLEGGAAPASIGPLDLSGATKLTLVVEMDERLYVADRLDWLGMRLSR